MLIRFIVVCLASVISLNALAQDRQARGVVQALHQATLSAELSAKVIIMPMRAGDAFLAGDLLVALDCEVFRAQSSKVAADVESAELRQQNMQRLAERRSVSKLEVALADVALRQAQAELRMADINVDRCEIRAPFDGRVVQRFVNTEESVEVNQELIDVVSTDHLEAQIVVPAQWVQWLKPGRHFQLNIDETGETLGATVVKLGSVVDPVSQTLQVRAAIDQIEHLLPGMSGTAYFD